MKRVLAVCMVGVVLALLLGGFSNQIPSAVSTDSGAVYAAGVETSGGCLVNPASGFECRIRCGRWGDGFGCWIECVW